MKLGGFRCWASSGAVRVGQPGAFHVCLWTFTMTEAWAWSRKSQDLDTDRTRRGKIQPAVRALRRSAEHSVVRCWVRSFERFYGQGRPGREFRRPTTGCSAWPRDVPQALESTVQA